MTARDDAYATDGVEWGETVPGWRPGATTVFVRATCCPKCGTGHVRSRGNNGNTDGNVSRWSCYRCDERWSLPAKHAGKRFIV